MQGSTYTALRVGCIREVRQVMVAAAAALARLYRVNHQADMSAVCGLSAALEPPRKGVRVIHQQLWCWSFLLYMYSKSGGQGYVPLTAVCERLPNPGNALCH